jgi:hypothetical protein
VALRFWLDLLGREERPRAIPRLHDDPPHLVLYTDAEGEGGIGAVLLDPAGAPPRAFASTAPEALCDHLRCSAQTIIEPLETYAALVALASLPGLDDALVTLYVDNTGTEAALCAGAADNAATNLFAGAVWDICARRGIGLWVERVASDSNCADLPSRGDSDLGPACGLHGVLWHEARHPDVAAVLHPPWAPAPETAPTAAHRGPVPASAAPAPAASRASWGRRGPDAPRARGAPPAGSASRKAAAARAKRPAAPTPGAARPARRPRR